LSRNNRTCFETVHTVNCPQIRKNEAHEIILSFVVHKTLLKIANKPRQSARFPPFPGVLDSRSVIQQERGISGSTLCRCVRGILPASGFTAVLGWQRRLRNRRQVSKFLGRLLARGLGELAKNVHPNLWSQIETLGLPIRTELLSRPPISTCQVAHRLS
jgi:hypothetical protein